MMEQKYKSLSLFEFQDRFPDDHTCLEYLAKMKWPGGFKCERCGHKKYCGGKTVYHRQCTSCHYQGSATSGTLFHKVKFSIQKALYIVYFMSTNKKGISSAELSRKLALRQKTCWLFQQKVRKAMASSTLHPLQGIVEVDETVVGGQESQTRGRKNVKKKLAVIGIERKRNGIARMYGQVINQSSCKELNGFFEKHIDKKAKIKTDGWRGYTPLKKQYKELIQELSGNKGKNFPHMHRAIMLFKAWLRGIHHSVNHLQAYIDDYTYRFNRSFMKEDIFENLMQRMITSRPCTYAQLCMP